MTVRLGRVLFISSPVPWPPPTFSLWLWQEEPCLAGPAFPAASQRCGGTRSQQLNKLRLFTMTHAPKNLVKQKKKNKITK